MRKNVIALGVSAMCSWLWLAAGTVRADFLVNLASANEIREYTDNGAYFTTVASGGDLNTPYGLLLTTGGDLYVANRGGGNILRYSFSAGAATPNGITPGSAVFASGLSMPFDVAFDRAGDLCVLDYQGVHRYNASTGASLGTFVPVGAGALNYPLGMTYGPDGNLYVADSVYLNGGWHSGVIKYDGITGAYLGVYASDTAHLGNAHELRFGPDGTLYVSTTRNYYWEYQGIVTFPAGGGTTATNLINYPVTDIRGFDFGPDGWLYYCQTNNVRLNRYNLVTGASEEIAVGYDIAVPTGMMFLPGVNVAPEPASLSLLVLGAGTFLIRRRK